MPRTNPRLAPIVFAPLLACSLFMPGNTATSPTATQGRASGQSAQESEQYRLAQLESQDAAHRQKLRAQGKELDALVSDASGEGKPTTTDPSKYIELAFEFSRILDEARASGAFERSLIDGPTFSTQALGYLDHAVSLEGAPAAQVQRERAKWLASLGRLDEAATADLVALEAGDSSSFDHLRALPDDPAVDERVLEACTIMRKQVSGEGTHDLVGVCLARAGGDSKRLKWKGAKKDVAAYQAEQKRREEEARLREEQEAARREAEAAAAAAVAAEAQSEQQLWTNAAVFASGRCSFSNCAGDGWESTLPDGATVRTRCNFGKCLTDGWETTFPDGSRARTRCNFGKCLEDGWETTFPDGGSASTRCSFGKCATDGWETRLPDGSTARTRCQFSKCFEDGWDTQLPTGGSVRCSCKFGDCLKNGADCG